MPKQPNLTLIVDELNQAANQIDEQQLEQLTDAISKAGRVFVAGAGRSGLMMRAFAMRLMHLGLDVYVVGETVTRSLSKDDLLLIGSGSGETKSLIPMAEKAHSLEAKVGALTLSETSTIGGLADIVVRLPGAPKDQAGDTASTIQPMGSLFEQILLLLCDTIILRLMAREELSGKAMYGNHANLE
ncbi:6-phospho 3-hexuloisomerase [Paenibacillus sp. FSL H8-0548]|uniref:6-phospho-3-hexuloisomerase n=1 Tax=Paenibacillus sp. FSL H8-0548 TaxID=1920422 RepID=UPI00096DA0FF|nr:6-phospho-3-hexuloisomerase [Paenibacillus sp. FSL H8-0548]OMF37361.1 6-phospho 3-hexuloisomerase [Paenibacillus sp. FSL H8-0548]